MLSRLEAVQSGTIQFTQIDSLKINRLPQNLLDQIFSNLNKQDLQAAVRVNRSMSRSAIAAANFNEPASIKKFIQSVIQRLHAEMFSMQREMLIKIAQNITPQNFVNLLLLKGYILDVKVQLVDVIKTLDMKMANNLRDHMQPPLFLKNIFELAMFERQIDAVNLTVNACLGGFELCDISTALAQAGNIDRAREVAMLIPDESVRGYAFSRALTRVGNIDQAIEISKSIPGETMRVGAIHDISKALIRAGNIDRAIEVAMSMSIPDKNEGEEVFLDISIALTRAGNIDRAIEIAMSIPDKNKRGRALRNISKALTRVGNIDRAIEIAMSILGKYERESAFLNLFEALTRAGNIDRAIEVAMSIPDKNERGRALRNISDFKQKSK